MDLTLPLILYWFILGFYNCLRVYGNAEVDALIVLKTQFRDPYDVLGSWNSSHVTPCNWFHVTCNHENSISRIDLGNAGLSGQLVKQLGELTNLQYLELYSNSITGRIPDELGNLTNFTVVGDFGLAKLMDCNDTHVTTGVRGMIGHIAPEYLATGRSSERSDVFGYGVMLLELITGQRAFDLARLANDEEVMLLDWVKGLSGDKKLEILVDKDLKGNYLQEEVEELIQIALSCTHVKPTDRPKMSQVVKKLSVPTESMTIHDSIVESIPYRFQIKRMLW